MNKRTLFMETTQIDPRRTAAEITSELLKAGAIQIATDYEKGRIKGLRWSMQFGDQQLHFSMPARVDPVLKILCERVSLNYLKYPADGQLRLKAERVAWRQLLRWVQAQLAMIETGMVQPTEVFLSYMVQPGSTRTLFEHFSENGMKMLTAPKENVQ